MTLEIAHIPRPVRSVDLGEGQSAAPPPMSQLRIAHPSPWRDVDDNTGRTEPEAWASFQDDRPFSATGDDTPIFNLLRVRRDLGASSTVRMVHTDRIHGADHEE